MLPLLTLWLARRRWVFHCVLVVLCLAGALIAISQQRRANAAALEKRVPWTSGHVTGTPEPPPAFVLKREFPKLTFKSPTEIVFEPGTNRMFISEQSGKIFSFPTTGDVQTADLAIDMRQAITDIRSAPGVRGFDSVYGLAFHPNYRQNHQIYICYALSFPRRSTDPVGTRVARFTVAGDPPHIDPASGKTLIEWQAGGHNGGCLKFGKDGYLYISAGDQADPDPPDLYNTGQDISDLRSSILRIDVDHADGDKPYSIPRDNPFVNLAGARGEVWCYGLRNPWRFSVDRATGNIWIGDVGWELWESVHCAKAGSNFGWSIMEGPNPIHPDGKRGPTPITPPLIALPHTESESITGGNVYRGKKYPELAGNYIFGDWMTRRVWAAKLIGDDKLEPRRMIVDSEARVVSFAEDAEGELYVLDYEGGGIYTLARNTEAGNNSIFPRTLKETGIFSDVGRQSPAEGVLPYSVVVPQWVDGASASRFIAVPGEGKIGWRTDDVYNRAMFSVPKDTVLARTFTLEMTAGDPATSRKVETQLMHYDGVHWHAYSYRWRDDQSDADLVDAGGADISLSINDRTTPGGKRPQTWHYASRAQCMTCHNVWAGYTLGYTFEQLACTQKYDNGQTDQQIPALRAVGLFPPTDRPQPTETNRNPPKWDKYTLVNPYDDAAPLEERARSYLHANCAHCHRLGGGGSTLIDVRREMSPKQTNLIDAPPMLGTFGIDDARIVTPGDPARSVLLYRISKTSTGRMPRLGSDLVDDRAAAMFSKWIAQMPSESQHVTAKDSAAQQAALASLKTPGAANIGSALDTLMGTPSGTLLLASALENKELPDNVREQVIAKVGPSPSPAVHDLLDHFAGITSQIPKLGINFDREKLAAMKGDATRGRTIFQSVSQCATCHLATGITGREYGPDLSHVATKYNRQQLIENIVEPSKVILEGFVTYNVLKTNGDVVSGFLVSKNDQEIVMKDSTLAVIHVPAGEVKRTATQSISAMPEGLLANLEPQQAADLLEFLTSLK